MIAAPFSAIMIVGALVLVEVTVGAQRRAGDAAGHDRGDQPDHRRLGELLPESECPKAVP